MLKTPYTGTHSQVWRAVVWRAVVSDGRWRVLAESTLERGVRFSNSRPSPYVSSPDGCVRTSVGATTEPHHMGKRRLFARLTPSPPTPSAVEFLLLSSVSALRARVRPPAARQWASSIQFPWTQPSGLLSAPVQCRAEQTLLSSNTTASTERDQLNDARVPHTAAGSGAADATRRDARRRAGAERDSRSPASSSGSVGRQARE